MIWPFLTGQGQAGTEDPTVIIAQLKIEKEREISQIKKKVLHESEERIASTQEALLFKIAKEEEENMRLRNKITNLDKELSDVAGERDRLLHEIQVLTDTHRVLEQRMATPPEASISPEYEEPLLVRESVDGLEVVPGIGQFSEGTTECLC